MRNELASILLRKSIGSMSSDRPRCAGCRRTPLTGELLHVLPSNRMLCELCLGRIPESEREPVRTYRVRAGERGLPVAPRAA